MCGICGLVSREALASPIAEQVDRMNAALTHRGPNGAGRFSTDNLVLAMRRLSIIDLSGGDQPLFNEDKSLCVLANGEIYNYLELQQQLKARGHHFQTASDIETLVHLYEDYGLDFVHHLRGMYAFVLYDSSRQRLIIGRDRIGEKPLYLYEQGEKIWFASELKAFIQAGIAPFELNPQALHAYFHYQYIPEPATAIKNIRKLPAGHLLIVDIENWQISEQRYWNMLDAPVIEGDLGALLRAELDEISKIIVRSDVPVGVALSGGLDSSLIAALAVRQSSKTIQAFSIGYEGRPHNDERHDAEKLAQYLGIPFHEIAIRTADMIAFFPQLQWHRDDPITDISGYGYYLISQLAREHNVTVLLQGQGGDELFWGYNWLVNALEDTYIKQALQGKPPKALLGLLHHLPFLRYPLKKEAYKAVARRWLRADTSLTQRWQYLQNSSPDTLIFMDNFIDFRVAQHYAKHVYGQQMQGYLADQNIYQPFRHDLPWDNPSVLMTQAIITTYLLENGIAQGDRLSMASSVELRLPLVDYRLVEMMIGYRKSKRDYHKGSKYWLRKIAQDVLPDWVINRPKRGFTPPVHEWYNALIATYGEQLRAGYLVNHGIITAKAAQEFADGQYLMEGISTLPIKALSLEFWCQQFAAHMNQTRN